MNKRFPIPHMNAVFFASIPVVSSPSARIHVVSFKFITENFDLAKENFFYTNLKRSLNRDPSEYQMWGIISSWGVFLSTNVMSLHFGFESVTWSSKSFFIVLQKYESCIRKFDIQNILFCNYHDKDNFESFNCSEFSYALKSKFDLTYITDPDIWRHSHTQKFIIKN